MLGFDLPTISWCIGMLFIDFSTAESVLELRPIPDPELGHVTHEDVKSPEELMRKF